jgi:exopolysaccharide biosynthesis protein
MVLSASESAAPFFRQLEIGQEVSIEWTLENLPPGLSFREIEHAVSAQPMLIRDGRLIDGDGAFWTTRHPRSAVAAHSDSKQVMLVVVDGRSSASAGMALGTLARYLKHLGAHQALNLDGGGSSAIGTRFDGTSRILNQPSDGRERPFPTGLGITTR